MIKKILFLLENLKKHREAGLMYCLSKPEDKTQIILLNRSINDLKEVIIFLTRSLKIKDSQNLWKKNKDN